MAELATVHEPSDLNRRGCRLYVAFRPAVPAGDSGWGAKGRAASRHGEGDALERRGALNDSNLDLILGRR